MTSETLSQSDIDRLLGGGGGDAGGAGSSGNRPALSGLGESDVQIYDFRRPHRVSKERLRTLEAMYERLVKGLEAWLISRLRGQVEMRLQSVEQFSFGEFTLSLPMPCSSFIFDITGTGQKGVVDIGPEFSTYLIDRLFGGEGTGASITRTLTPIERLAIRGVADRVTALLQEVWQDHVPLELGVTGFESSPEILQVVNREDPVLVANVEFSAGGVNSLLLICLPFSVLDKFFTAGSAQRFSPLHTSEQEREQTRQRSEAALRATRVPLVARLPEFRLSLRDIAQIAEGQIVPTGIPKDARVIVRAGTQERFIGHAGRVNGNLAVRIADAVPTPSTPTPGTSA
jgi:flagellar motor switch protein FliM